jgi:hypothetical protein
MAVPPAVRKLAFEGLPWFSPIVMMPGDGLPPG